MNKLPCSAQLFLITVYLAGLAAGGLTLMTQNAAIQTWELGVYLVLAALIGRTKIRLLRPRNAEESVSMSLGYVLTFTALLRFGATGALLVGAVGALSNSLYPKRQPVHQMSFNIALTLVEARLASFVFLQLNHQALALHSPESYPAVAAACLICFLVNTGGVATIMALCTSQNAWILWRNTFCGQHRPILPAGAPRHSPCCCFIAMQAICCSC